MATNYDMYKNLIEEAISNNNICGFVKCEVNDKNPCNNTKCRECSLKFSFWLMKEYEEKKVDWDEVKIDTLVKVKTRSTDTGVLRYFAGVDEFGYPRVFADGATSKTAPKNFDGTSVTEIVSDEYSTIWKEIELYKEDEELPFN